MTDEQDILMYECVRARVCVFREIALTLCVNRLVSYQMPSYIFSEKERKKKKCSATVLLSTFNL